MPAALGRHSSRRVKRRIGVHFIGSVVHIDDGLGNITVQAAKLVIDGRGAKPGDRCQNGDMRGLS